MKFESDSASIIIPIFNMAGRLQYLKSAVANLLNSNIQVILVNDYYDVATSEELSKFEAENKSSKLTFLEGKFGGPGKARNAGLAVANGEYITFWDSDDKPNVENYLEFVNKALAEKKDLGVSAFLVTTNENQTRHFKLKHRNFGAELSNIALHPGIWRFIFNRRVLVNLEFSDSRMGEDQVFIAKAILKSNSQFIFHESTYEYFIGHAGQLTQNKNNVEFINQSLEELSKIAISSCKKSNKDFVALMYWKMFLSLLINKKFTNPEFRAIKHLQVLRQQNPELSKRVILHFFKVKNYWRLR